MRSPQSECKVHRGGFSHVHLAQQQEGLGFTIPLEQAQPLQHRGFSFPGC